MEETFSKSDVSIFFAKVSIDKIPPQLAGCDTKSIFECSITNLKKNKQLLNSCYFYCYCNVFIHSTTNLVEREEFFSV